MQVSFTTGTGSSNSTGDLDGCPDTPHKEPKVKTQLYFPSDKSYMSACVCSLKRVQAGKFTNDGGDENHLTITNRRLESGLGGFVVLEVIDAKRGERKIQATGCISHTV